ncbi:MAG TPA: nuclear transport factor 2 family protein [Edaphobacter sp.]|uniref:YybH family protein n=1 Tax=Edaphobacter sp. TaxID=1934404 RepID=UPI002B909E1D|nr:nuclear transport factor 2 family protein [Edaphobacter sp.]HUZ93994.1 nuclear transport factor 2 family protein [Edaphobacter sp.]
MPRFRAAVIPLLVVALFAVPVAHSQDLQALTTASRQQLDVVKVLLTQEAAWNRGDIDAFVQTYKDAPDTLMVTHQISHGFAGLVEEYKHDYPTKAAMGTLAFSELEARPLDANFAIVVGKYHLERAKKEGGNAEGVFSVVLEKTDKGWKIVLDHTT